MTIRRIAKKRVIVYPTNRSADLPERDDFEFVTENDKADEIIILNVPEIKEMNLTKIDQLAASKNIPIKYVDLSIATNNTKNAIKEYAKKTKKVKREQSKSRGREFGR